MNHPSKNIKVYDEDYSMFEKFGNCSLAVTRVVSTNEEFLYPLEYLLENVRTVFALPVIVANF